MGLGRVLVGLCAVVMSRLRMLLGEVVASVSMLMRGFAVMMSSGLMMGRGVVVVFN